MRASTHIVPKPEVELLQDEEIPAEHGSREGHVAHGLAHHAHRHAAAVQLREADAHVQRTAC